MPSLFVGMFLLIFFVPQFFAQFPGMPEFLRPADIVGAACLAIYAVLRLTVKRNVNPAERLLLLFLLWSFVVSSAGLVLIGSMPEYARKMGVEQVLYPVRHLFIFGPGLLAFALKPPPRAFVRLGLFAFTAAAIFVIFMTLAYMAGSDAFNAHQSLRDGGIVGAAPSSPLLGNYFKRMGGIVGESGAYAFHGLFVIAALTVFAFLGGMSRLGYVLIAATPLWALMVFATSQSRILLLTLGAFLLVLLLDRRVVTRSLALTVCLAVAAAVGAAALLVVVLDLSVPINPLLALRFQALLEGRVSGVQLTSGRLEHWGNVVELLAYNPVLGYGYRNVGFMLDHGVENFFLQGLSEFGFIGFVFFLAFLFRIWRAMGREMIGSPARDQRAKAVMRAMLAAALVQWQVNDINTYWLTFPMMIALSILVISHTGSWTSAAARPGDAGSRADPAPRVLPAMGG
ncbi:MAG: O-antigen ligase family protein [Pseudomonadota bacterium]